MDGLTALLAGWVGGLRAALGIAACPGPWPWAVSLLGVGVGLLPTVGLFGVAILRRRVGSRYRVGSSVTLAGLGVVFAGLLPLVVFNALGRAFELAAGDDPVPGLTRAQLRDVGRSACLGLAQADYLGGYPVSAAFAVGQPLRLGAALVMLVLAPVLATLFLAVQTRLVLRRGPRWPSLFFTMSLLSLALLTARVSGGTAGQLWVGMVVGTIVGIAGALLFGAPSREAVDRSLVGAPAQGIPAPPEPEPPARASTSSRIRPSISTRGEVRYSSIASNRNRASPGGKLCTPR